jgi:hypothetical protein
VALCQARISTKPLWGFSSSNPYHSQSRAEHLLIKQYQPETEIMSFTEKRYVQISNNP